VCLQVRQYQKRIAVSLAADRQLAKQLLKEGKTERAKLLLRKKKYLESLLDKADNQLDQLGTPERAHALFLLLCVSAALARTMFNVMVLR
jgi:hypothetical protein